MIRIDICILGHIEFDAVEAAIIGHEIAFPSRPFAGLHAHIFNELRRGNVVVINGILLGGSGMKRLLLKGTQFPGQIACCFFEAGLVVRFDSGPALFVGQKLEFAAFLSGRRPSADPLQTSGHQRQLSLGIVCQLGGQRHLAMLSTLPPRSHLPCSS